MSDILQHHPGFEMVGPIGDHVIELREPGLPNASEHRRAVLARVPTCVVGEWWSDTTGEVWVNEGYVGAPTDSRQPCDRHAWVGMLKGVMRHVVEGTIVVEWKEPNTYALCVAVGMGIVRERFRGRMVLSLARLEEWIDKCRVASIDLVSVMNGAGVTVASKDEITNAIVASYGFEHLALEWTCTFGEGDD